MTVRLAAQGFRVAYEPQAIAAETGSANVEEEEKRKIRISAGGIQAINRLPELMNWLKHPGLTFQYISHRVLRWTLMPVALIIAMISSVGLLDKGGIYTLVFLGSSLILQLCFGGLFQKKSDHLNKVLPHPILFHLYAHLRGQRLGLRYWKGKQSVTWEKSIRAVPEFQTSKA